MAIWVSFLRLYHPVPAWKRECWSRPHWPVLLAHPWPTLYQSFLISMIGYAIQESHAYYILCIQRIFHISTDDVKKLCHSCRICAELKPQFYLPQQNTLIKATQPMERWSIDFKGPLRSSSQNTYILTIVDEYSRFPFAFPCPNTTSATVMKCLEKMFVLCSSPSYIHSDCGSSFFVPRK